MQKKSYTVTFRPPPRNPLYEGDVLKALVRTENHLEIFSSELLVVLLYSLGP